MKTKVLLPFLAVVALLTALCGCASVSSGRQIDESRISSIGKGTTTRAELIAWFGEPQQVAASANGTTVMTWQYGEFKGDKKALIPIVGPFMSHNSQLKTSVLTVTLDQSGVVQDYQWEKGSY